MFVRASTPAAASTPAPGTRPGPGGAPVVSSGVAGLDSALRGGVPTGRALLLEPAPAAGAADAFIRLFVAEGVACGHAVTWVQAGVDEGDEAAWWLPAPRERRAAANADDAAPAAADLKIAWQYRRYIAAKAAAADEGGVTPAARRAPRAPGASAGALPAWCHDFDVKARQDAPERVTRVGGTGAASAAAAVDAAVAAARAAREPTAPPARIVLVLPSAPAWQAEDVAPSASVIALRRARGAARGGRAALLVVAPPGTLPPAATTSARSAADGVLTLAPLRSDGAGAALLAGRRDAAGLLAIATPPRAGAGYARPPPAAPLYVVTRRGGRVGVREADVDPDAEAAGAGVAAMACGGGGKASALDF